MKQILYIFLTLKIVFCDINDNEVKDCDLPEVLINEIASYKPIVEKIINEAINGSFQEITYNELAQFVDKFGSRLSGTENLENAIDYLINRSLDFNLEDVHGEEVNVPYWQRGEETARLLVPLNVSIGILGLGSSVGTPLDGITAEAIVVKDFDELRAAGSQVKGKIIIFNPNWVNYGVTVQYRVKGASEAAKLGAVATLIRSITPFSLYTLHTGWQTYENGVKKIPTACITVEDAEMLQRMQNRGDTIKIYLKMIESDVKMRKSRNTVANINGKIDKNKFVLVSGHVDSWDVGKGAMDDAAGVFISWGALALLKRLNLRAKRTLRAVLWTGEEPGLVGAFAYAVAHNNLNNFNFVIESDGGTFTPYGIQYKSNIEGGCILKEILKLLGPINTTKAEYSNDVGSDITIWEEKGVSGATLLNDDKNYYWYHHSNADTMDVENADNLDKGTAIFATVAYIIADLSIDFPRITDDIGVVKQKMKKFQRNQQEAIKKIT